MRLRSSWQGWFMSKFLNTISISDIGQTITGKTPSSNCPNDFGEKYMFVTPSDSFDNKFISSTERYLSQEGIDKLTSKILPPSSIMVTCIGSAMGKVSMNKTKAITNQQINSIKISDKFDPHYIYYLLKNNYKLLRTAATGSTALPLLNKTDFDDLTLNAVLNKMEQKKIANVLSSLDSKIELNNKINKELEAIAKTLYDYWFVQFDFPDEKGKPYKSSGGKMVYNKELKRDIPEGWETKKLDDIISKTGTGLNPRDNFKLGFGNNYYVTIKNIEQGKVILDDKCDKVDDEALKIINRRSDLQVGDILFTSIQPVGVTYLIQERPQNWNINESVFTIRPNYNLVSSDYLFMLLSSDFMKAYTNNVSAGSIHKGVRHTDLKSFKFAYSGNTIIDNFNKSINPMLKKMYINEQQNQELLKLRDWLLPMLMNGQVRVNIKD